MTTRALVLGFAVGGAAATMTLVAPASAYACGGFFCSRQPIEQSGENIIFAVEDDGTMETHVQILYRGTAESFAWILPVPALPEIGVGTNLLFQQVRQATNPLFRLDYEQTGTCRPTPNCFWHFFQTSETNTAPSDPGLPATTDRRDVEVLSQEAVGPYDAVVLSAGDATALFAWLTDNGYDIPEASVPLLMQYIEDGNFFLALKLRQDRGTGEILPVVLRYAEQTPCVPIKLTSIATIADMPVTALILGDRRARPTNYLATEPDLDDAGFWLGAESYTDAVTRAVDDAGGQAFVTDYAGDTPELSLTVASIEDLRIENDPGMFLMALRERGFDGDSQLLGILLRYIPPPDDLDANRFYNCLTSGFCSDDLDAYIATLVFDPNALVDDLEEAIVEPRRNAQSLVDRHPQLTRLFTTMSAEDMTLDPLFDLDVDVPEVSNIHEATYFTECSEDFFAFHAPQRVVLPSGREEVVQEGIAYSGTDRDYCEDFFNDTYGPDVDPETARATAAHRAMRLGGGGGCGVAVGRSGASLVFFALILGLGVRIGRRRRQR